MTQCSIDNYRRELERAKQSKTFGCTAVATKLLSRILDDYSNKIREYLDDYSKGKAVRSTLAANVVSRLNNVEVVAYLTSKIILNSMWAKIPTQAMYKAIGQAIEDEFKMREFKSENAHYYKTIQADLNRRGAKANRKKNITTGVFNKRLDFHLDRWTVTEKFQTGLVLTHLFVESTGLVEYEDVFKKNKHLKILIPTQELVNWTENMNEKLELMQPLFLPMVCQPKEWTSILEGGYISPYLKKNKLIKNNNKDYLKKLETAKMPIVYEAINHLQNTQWQVNKRVLDVVKALWEEGRAVAELPDREDELLIPYPYPDRAKASEENWSEEEIEIIKKWKRDTYEIHKRNVQKRSVRLLVSQIIRIADQFAAYDTIWFPHQMDFRGRLYPIPVLLQPQGTDLSKGLLHFARGKPVDNESIKWLQIHGANVYGYDKENYENRACWTKSRSSEILSYAENPLLNRGWTEADKPFQFLAFCFEYRDYLSNPESFRTHIPIQLDGTCNGLQHYSALLRDPVGGSTVNLVNTEKPSDIYAKVAEKLEEKLNGLREQNIINNDDNINDRNSSNTDSRIDRIGGSNLARHWLNLGINRKLTKRPVMVLPYGGTMLSCREYIQEYLTDNYSPNFIWKHFEVGENPTDCIFKISVWLSKYLWESIQETLKAATVGMDYLRNIARVITKEKQYIEWLTPAGLLVRQAYASRKKKEIKTELYGSILKTTVNLDLEILDTQRQLNGICPNFIHSLDASCLMLYLIKCKKAGINSFMTVHDCYGTHAADTEQSAKLLREAFVEIYRQPILENFTEDVLSGIEVKEEDIPEIPEKGSLDIEDVLKSDYFFN
nr:MAG TPA: DNA directed RNA polymerase [Caudoviricetes sp.]